MNPKHVIRVLLVQIFCVEKHTRQRRMSILHQNDVTAGKASVIKRSDSRHSVSIGSARTDLKQCILQLHSTIDRPKPQPLGARDLSPTGEGLATLGPRAIPSPR